MKNFSNQYLRRASWALLFAAATVALWYACTPTLKGISISPRNVYRLEYYEASLLQSLIHPDFKMPSFVRLYRIAPETLLGTSAVVDLWINGQLYWYLNPPMNKVRVGRDVVFENIPPECTDCPPLTDAEIMP
ncbi:hypothetical protein SAMN05192589_10521 [Paracidovorax valerianellae]|uniref:Uncharacterized protein n=2 Tax=Paracidovorax valerianellae TaxID=187868 RepID=A0A1G6T1M7_9BURK|nr:hypothetical protein [Paracidovorax valerianellae]MDA8445458.1 hypothetical protein [Paracidovorax valerianellae]SDD22387.1 hypothetical protein SAMN05192589_10521 [Paracidovorax valerianellae]